MLSVPVRKFAMTKNKAKEDSFEGKKVESGASRSAWSILLMRMLNKNVGWPLLNVRKSRGGKEWWFTLKKRLRDIIDFSGEHKLRSKYKANTQSHQFQSQKQSGVVCIRFSKRLSGGWARAGWRIGEWGTAAGLGEWTIGGGRGEAWGTRAGGVTW